MTKVSKNLKKFRMAKNLTQDTLAEKLFVTRQTISGWENDRTQPDIEMLCKISEVLEVSVEDLIYGEKRYATPEEKTQSRKRSLIIIFSIIASVLTGTGLILIFITCWEMLPFALKGVFAFIPMLAGQAAAIFTYLKHKDSAAWREGASVLWCAGIAATVALVNGVFDIDGGFNNCLLADILMFLPVIYVLDTVAPLAVYFGGVVCYGINLFNYGDGLLVVSVMLVLYFAGLGYVLINRKKKDDIRHIYTVWLSVVAALVITVLSVFDTDAQVIFTCATAFLMCIYFADKNGSWVMPYTPLGLFGLSALSVTTVFVYDPGMPYFKFDTEILPVYLICIAAVATCTIIGSKGFKNNIAKTVYCSFALLNLLSQIVCSIFFSYGNTVMYIIILFSSLGMALSLIAFGAVSGKFVPMNLGLVSASVIVGYMIVMLIDIGILAAGIMLVAFGLILFAVNYLLARKLKNSKEEGTQNA